MKDLHSEAVTIPRRCWSCDNSKITRELEKDSLLKKPRGDITQVISAWCRVFVNSSQKRGKVKSPEGKAAYYSVAIWGLGCYLENTSKPGASYLHISDEAFSNNRNVLGRYKLYKTHIQLNLKKKTVSCVLASLQNMAFWPIRTLIESDKWNQLIYAVSFFAVGAGSVNIDNGGSFRR